MDNIPPLGPFCAPPWDEPDPPCPQACDLCDNWRECPLAPGIGWCVECGEYTEPDGGERCEGFSGDLSGSPYLDPPDPPDIDR